MSQAALLDEARHSFLSGDTGIAPLGPQQPYCAPSLAHPTPFRAPGVFSLTAPEYHTSLLKAGTAIEAASKVSVQFVNFPSRWQVLGNYKPRQLTCPNPHVLTTAFANNFKKTHMVFWGRDKVFQTQNWLLQLSLVSDQTGD